jgi:WD40 repeat protein
LDGTRTTHGRFIKEALRYLRFWNDSVRGERSLYCIANFEPKPTICKIFVNQIPLGHVNHPDFIELVAQRDVRPERPDIEDAPQLSDAIWTLAEKCWVTDPKQRPTAGAVCDLLSHLVDNISVAQLNPGPSPFRPMAPAPNLTMRGHTGNVLCAAFSLDGKQIVSGSDDCNIRVWDAHTGNSVMGPLKIHTEAIVCVTFSPDGSQIASGSRDNTVLVYDVAKGQAIIGPFKGCTAAIWSVSFSPDGKRIASGSGDKKSGYGIRGRGTLL